jgi:pSer/pThr/pTyr-binding forkhead associated (FHA) protein
VDEVVTPVVGDTDKPPTGAFLIIQGKRHYRLKKHLITIGRRLDSDLVLDDQHISRKHAKLLARHGKYVLIDEKSTAGTRVNGQLIDEQTLKPGDVITIAKIDLIYGEGPEGPPDITPPYRPTDKPTDRDQITPLGLKLKYEDDTVALGKKGKKDSTEP